MTREDKILERLETKYKKAVMTKAEVAHELGIGLSTISKLMSEGAPLPIYHKVGMTKNSRVIFPLVDVASFLANGE